MIETDRLILRGWREADIEPFAAMGADPRVMAHFPALLTRGESIALVRRQQAVLAAVGHCFWAIERKSDRAFLGFCGVQPGPEGTPIEGLAEIGWRLARNHWGQGYAAEAAQGSLAWAWARTDTPRVYAIAPPRNERSRALMRRIGMAQVRGGDFDHPRITPGHPLRRCLFYVVERPGDA